jgi:dienelactone hydrolase
MAKLRIVLVIVFATILLRQSASWASGANLDLPAGSGPFPVVILVPTCSGFGGFTGRVYDRFSQTFVEAGFAVSRVDFLAPRGLSLCLGGSPPRRVVSMRDVAVDIYRAIDALAGNPALDARRISLVGYSYGGGAILTALAGNDPARAKIHSVIVYYPDCAGLGPWSGSTPTLIFFGGADAVAPRAVCNAVMAQMPDTASIRIIEFPEAMHGFNFYLLPRSPGLNTIYGPMGYDPSAALRARNAALRLLRQ